MPKMFTLSVEVPDEKVGEMLEHFQGLQRDILDRFRYVHMGMTSVDLEDEPVVPGEPFEVPEGGFFRKEGADKIEIYDSHGNLIRSVPVLLDVPSVFVIRRTDEL
jgi:hypothetical protein